MIGHVNAHAQHRSASPHAAPDGNAGAELALSYLRGLCDDRLRDTNVS
jgi:hypothetical protein